MIEKLEVRINNIKRKANKKAVGVAIFMVFGAVIIFAMEMTNNFKRQKDLVQNEYNKSMYTVVSYINNLESELAKLQVTSTADLTAVTLANIWKNSNLAKENLESIPLKQNSIANAAKYLSQVSDFSYVLMKQNISGEKLTEEEISQVSSIYGEAKQLSKVMSGIYSDLNAGRIKWDELEKKGNSDMPDAKVGESLSNVSKIGKTFQEYEGLIYDGAFSDHLLTQTPKSLVDNEVTMEQAKEYLYNIFGKDKVENITDKEDSKGRIELYNFDVKLKDSKQIRSVSVTKKDCKMYLMISDRKVAEEKISIDEAKQKGLEFLKKLGMENVKDTYYQKLENMATINYAAVQDGVILYPDLIKVKVALDDGEICSVECQGYIFNHHTRDNLKPQISLEEAKLVLNKNISIISSDIAVIPTESKEEILTYEFKGKIDQNEFLVYINAKTKKEEKVLLILKTPGGILTM